MLPGYLILEAKIIPIVSIPNCRLIIGLKINKYTPFSDLDKINKKFKYHFTKFFKLHSP